MLLEPGERDTQAKFYRLWGAIATRRLGYEDLNLKVMFRRRRQRAPGRPRGRRLVIGIFVLLLIGGLILFVVQRRARAQQPQPIVLNILMSAPEVPQWRALADQFEQNNPGIRLNLVEGPNASNLIEDLYTSAFLLGKSPYDLVYMDVVWVPKFAAAGWLTDLAPRLAPQEAAQFSAPDLGAGRYQGGLYRLPVRQDIGMLYYRQDLLDQQGIKPPETFDELITISQRLQDPKSTPWGYVWQGKQYEGLSAMFVEVLQGHGGYWIDPATGGVGLDQPQAIQAVHFLKTTLKQISPPGVTSYQEDDARLVFQSGQAVFLRSWPYVWPLANSPESPIRGKLAIVPMVHVPGSSSGACLGGAGFGIAKSTPHPEAAWKAVQFLTSEATMRQLVLNTGYLPSRMALFQDPAIQSKYPYFPQMAQIAQRATPRPAVAQYAPASDILQRYLSAALTNRLTPEVAMTKAALETRQLLGDK